MALRALLSGSTAVGAGRKPRSRGKSLGVLPFVNAGADPTIEYLTDGITESIINSVSQLAGLRVVPRSLVFRYKGLQADPSTIGVALNARTILTGRVSQQGDYLTIQAELVDTATESQLWGEQFRPRLSELPNVQQDIAWQISEALRLKLTGAQKKKLRKRASVNPEAYQEYLRGRHFFNAWSPDGFRKALEHFERAIERDPAYAPAYAGLGDAIGCMSYYGLISPHDGFPRARAAAEKAIALDPDLAEAYGTLALGSLFRRRDWEEAARQFGRSIALNPKLASVRAFHSILLSTLGRHDEAIAEARAGAGARPAVAARQHERRLGALLRRPAGADDRRAAAHARPPRSRRRRGARPADGRPTSCSAGSRRRREPQRATSALACRPTPRRCSPPGAPGARTGTGSSVWRQSIARRRRSLPMATTATRAC